MIRLVTLLEFPVVAGYLGQTFGARGCVYDWPALATRGEYLTTAYSGFYEAMLRGANGAPAWRRDPGGDFACSLVTDDVAVVAASVPCHLLESKTHAKRRVMRFLRASARAQHVIARNAATYLLNKAAVHGLVNMNGQILGNCEAIEAGAPEAKHLTSIKKSCHHLTALVASTAILSPEWSPDLSRNPLNRLHQALTMQKSLWQFEFTEKALRAVIDECYAQVHMAPDVLSTIFFNLFANAAKYAVRGTDVHISFSENAEFYTVMFGMQSANIFPDEVERIRWPGERGRLAVADGEGIGLAVIDRALRAYGGRLRINAGLPDSLGPGSANNEFAVDFDLAKVR